MGPTEGALGPSQNDRINLAVHFTPSPMQNPTLLYHISEINANAIQS